MFGQLVLGPAGSGKTTFCNGMLHYLTLSGAWFDISWRAGRATLTRLVHIAPGRKAAVVNLDPANDALPYEVRGCAAERSRRVLACADALGLSSLARRPVCCERV